MGTELPAGELGQCLSHFVATAGGHGSFAPYLHIVPKALIQYLKV